MMNHMCFFGIFLLTALLDNVVAPPGGEHNTKMCLACHDIADPASCTTLERCPERFCVSDAYLKDGEVSYFFSCHGECDPMHINFNSLLGKRARHDHGTHLCRTCCADTDCEKTACDEYQHLGETTRKTTTTTTTTKKPTTTTTTTRKPTTTTTTTIKPTTTTTTPKPTTTIDNNSCRNHESGSFKCTELDKYNFCSDPSSVAYVLAHDKCALHCGLCSPDGTLPPKTTYVPPITDEPIVVDVTQPQGTDTAAPTTTTPNPCVDNEYQQFNCTEWQSFGFCEATSGVGHTIAMDRCKKTCGLCQV